MLEALEVLFAQFPAHKTEGSEEARLAGYQIALKGVDPRDLRSAVERVLTDTSEPRRFCPTGPELRAICEQQRRSRELKETAPENRRLIAGRKQKAKGPPLSPERVKEKTAEFHRALAKIEAKAKTKSPHGPVRSRWDTRRI